MKILPPLSANSHFFLLIIFWLLHNIRGIHLTADASSYPSPLGGRSPDVHQRGHFLLDLELISIHPSELTHLELDVCYGLAGQELLDQLEVGHFPRGYQIVQDLMLLISPGSGYLSLLLWGGYWHLGLLCLLDFDCWWMSSFCQGNLPGQLLFGSLDSGVRLFDLSDSHALLLSFSLCDLSVFTLLPLGDGCLAANLGKILDEA